LKYRIIQDTKWKTPTMHKCFIMQCWWWYRCS